MAESEWGPARQKTVSWHNPMVGAKAWRDMSGLEYLHAMLDGTLPPPPIANLLNMMPTSADTGTVTFTCTPDESAP